MTDLSHLDKKYFIDGDVYNCPFCNRNNVLYKVTTQNGFNWSKNKAAYYFVAKCSSCSGLSFHLSSEPIWETRGYGYSVLKDKEDKIDELVFYSVPTSYFVLDDRIPGEIRALISEAEGCLKMNFLVGGSACARKTIYELLRIEKIEASEDCSHYEDRIKSLKAKHPEANPALFDMLNSIQKITSDPLHEASWEDWSSAELKLVLETLRGILVEIYVLTEEKKKRFDDIKRLQEAMKKQ